MAHEHYEPIPPERWGAFFEQLNDACRGLRARVETGALAGPAQVVAADSPFAGIIDSEDGIVIELAAGFSYNVGLPRSVTSGPSLGGEGQTIVFETSAEQVTTLLLASPEAIGRAVGAAAAEPGGHVSLGGSAGAAGGSSAAPGGAGADDDGGGLISFGSSDDMGRA